MLALACCAGFAHGAQGGGACLAFDGVDDFVRVARTALLEPEELTVELWAWIDGPQDWNTRLLRKGERDAYFLTADQDLDQRMQLLVTRGTALRVQARDPVPHVARAGAWHHFAGVWSVTNARFFVDGVQVADVAHELGALTHEPPTDLYLGAGLPVTLQNEYFAGRIDEARVWARARTSAEILSTWDRPLVGTEPGLVAYWRFDEGSGQVAHDDSAHGHDGRLGATIEMDASDPVWLAGGAPLAPFECWAVNYCASTPNSSGHAATMGFTGSLSIAANDARLHVYDAPAGHAGLFFCGREPARLAFLDGYLCISPFTPGLVRLPPVVVVDGDRHASRALDLAAPPSSVQVLPGDVWRFQFWFRDGAAGGTGANLSDGLAVRFCP
ncbi:MAG: LamG domain-containing protein [Planctomycetes bacterium]|nr:LamG domain-containing protein [Planctomycetota bacterium]